MICVAATYVIKPGHEDEAVGHIRALMAASRLEPGCRYYMPNRSPKEPCQFFFYEQYDDQAAFDAHLASPHFVEHGVNGLVPIAESRNADFYAPIDAPQS